MDEVNYGEELAKARSVALSGRANEIESELLGPYTRHLLTEIANLYPNLRFQDFTKENYPRWWSDEDQSVLESALFSLKMNLKLREGNPFYVGYSDDHLSWYHLMSACRKELRLLEQMRHFPRSGEMGDYGYHLLREVSYAKLSNRLGDFGREELPAWWTREEVELFYSLVKEAERTSLGHGESD